MTGTPSPKRRSERYPFRNSSGSEGRRLEQLEALGDPVTISALEALGVGPGWRCAELGAGGGSIVRWLADRVGTEGAVTAVDRDTTRLTDLARRENVEVVEGDLAAMGLPESAFDLVHTRSVLMHLEDPDRVVRNAVASLRPGGRVLFEESDGAPGAAVEDGPAPFMAVFVPIVRRWTWAGGLAGLLESLGLVDVEDHVSDMALVGGSSNARFWQVTLESVGLLVDAAEERDGPRAMGFDRADLQAMWELLEDPGFCAPFVTRHRVTGRRAGRARAPASSGGGG